MLLPTMRSRKRRPTSTSRKSRSSTSPLAFSFGNMGFALMGFDSAEGLHHLPGTSRSYAVKLLVLVMRVAEVSSRITSIALFSVCTRGWIPLQFADSWPQPLQFLCKSFLLTAGPCLAPRLHSMCCCLSQYFQTPQSSSSEKSPFRSQLDASGSDGLPGAYRLDLGERW